MSRLINLVDKRFGQLIVIERTDDNVLPSGLKEPMWLCTCSCGNDTIVRGAFLRSGHTASCGCLKRTIGLDDLGGRTINGIRVIERHSDETSPVEWLCECHCGSIFITRGSSLKNKHTKSCGCRRKQLRIKDMVGQKFSRLTVLSRGIDEITPSGKTRFIRWECRCECGREVLTRGTSLRSGHTTSCGCARFDNLKPTSNGEIWISEYLAKHGYKYISQKTYPTLLGVGGGLLLFDFAVKTTKGTLLIECQGSQHYEPNAYFGGVDVFETQVEHDDRKRRYVRKRKDLSLVEIPYLPKTTRDDLLNLLSKELSNYSI